MRQLIVKVPRGQGSEVLRIAQGHEGENLARFDATDREGEWELVLIHTTNRQVGAMIDALDSFSEAQVTLIPQGVMPMSPPASSVAEHISRVEPRSPVEIWINGLQSIGTWKAFLAYVVAASIVVWIGMFTNTSFLLVAAMLISPLASPAMNMALGSATGSRHLLTRNALRYTAALLLTILVTAALSWLLSLDTATATMIDVSSLSSVAILLPLIVGAAGALNLIQDENNSLVSGAAVGSLIAAALTPPAGLVGMALVIQRWDMATDGLFLLAMQLVAINLSGALTFRAYGLKPEGVRYERGDARIFYLSIVLTALVLIGLLGWQFRSTPELQRSTRAQRALAEAQTALSDSELVSLVQADFRFTRPMTEDNTLLGVIYVRRKEGVTLSDGAIEEQVSQVIRQRLLEQGFNVEPLIDVNVLEGS